MVRLIFLKCCRENTSFKTLRWANKHENLSSDKFFPPIGQFISQSYLLSENTVPQAQAAFICLNSAILTVEYSARYVQVNNRNTRRRSGVFIVNFEYI